MKKQTSIIVGVIILIIIIGAVAMSKKSAAPATDNSMAGMQQTAPATPTDTSVTPMSDAGTTSQPPAGSGIKSVSAPQPVVKSFTVTGSNFAFIPKTLTVNKGDTVKITFKNSGGMHDFKIDEFGVATERLESGDSTTVQFVADKAGSFQYYCSVGSHRAMGMWGTLTVI